MFTTPTWKSISARIWSKSQSAAKWRLPFALFACALLAYATAFAWHTLTSFDIVSFINANADDAFYYFQIAYNLSQGKFSTFDGGITQTNGYQPVWLMLITPFYWLFDKETALYGIKAFEIMLVAGGVAVIAFAAWLSRLAWPLLFAALPMLYRNPVELLWGMEAAAALFTLSLLILAVCLYMRSPDRWKWHVAALAFALPWVRIEYIAISIAVTAALCAIEWSRQERRSLRLSELANIRRSYIPLMGAIAGILVYFAYNGLVFGGVLPVSAATKLALSQAQWAEDGGYSFLENFQYMIRQEIFFDDELLIALEICAYLLLAWRFALRSNDRRDWLMVAFLVGAFGLAAGHIAKFAQTVLATHPDTGNQIWYFVPAYLMTALIIPIRLYIAIHLIRRFLAPRWRIAANALCAGVVVTGAALLIGNAGFAEPFKWVDKDSGSIQIGRGTSSYMGAQVMNRALPEGSVIGAWDAGVIGYFSRFPVVNLDGLVNSYEHLDIIRQRQTSPDKHATLVDLQMQMAEAARSYGITHFANNMRYDYTPPNIIFEAAPFDASAYGEHRFKIWLYADAPVEIDYSQLIWERLQSRLDYSSGGVGIVSEGRTAQAFAKNCAPDDLLIWTWSGQERERTVSLETNLRPSRANLCIASRLLPRSATAPAQAELAPLNDYFANLTASEEPIIRSKFDLYISDGSLIYAKPQCAEPDVEPRFFANIYPVDTDDLLEKYDKDTYDIFAFNFDDRGATTHDGKCLAAIDLPDYPIDRIRAGQYVTLENDYHYLWEYDYKVGASAYRVGVDADFAMLSDREPIIRSNFDVHFIYGNLIYAKEQCAESDVQARFFANIFPFDANDLPNNHNQRAYDAITFNFADYGKITHDGKCWAEINLPSYPITEIHTGQYAEAADERSNIWEGAYSLGVDAEFRILASRSEPIIRSNFDVYLNNDSLIYTKPQCSQEDVEAQFFANIFPVDANDLPDRHRYRGYETMDFNFNDYGAITDDNRCWLKISLPDYAIAEIHAGQFVELEDSYTHTWMGSYVSAPQVGEESDLGKLEGVEPLIRARFDVYLIDGSLIYTKSQCDESDMEARIFADIFPVDPSDLPNNDKQRGYQVLDFSFGDYGAIAHDGSCRAEVELPDYPLIEIYTAQYVTLEDGYANIWEGSVYPLGMNIKADFGKLADLDPIIRSNFDVYIIDDSLIYAKPQCGDEDVAGRFSISIYPVDVNDMPALYWLRGYYAREFKFKRYGAIANDGSCWAEINLPNFPIASIHLGQYALAKDGGNYLWDGVHTIGAGSYTVGGDADFEMLANRDPIIRSNFDVYLIDRSLIYANEHCAEADIDTRLSLSIIPVDANDLPDHLIRRGYADINFSIDDDDVTADGKCWAEVTLPDYPISEIHTGQFVVLADNYDYLWKSAYRFE